jgi:hypothetical protein
MDERLRFVARLLDGEKMAPLCAEFGISRKTGYKIYHRYKGCGIDGLTDRSRRPLRHANQLPEAIEKLIVRLKREYPTWGAPKIRERLRRRYAATQCPAISTCTRCWTGTAWSCGGGSVASGRRARRSLGPRPRMPCGARTTRASSCSLTGATAIH